MERKPIGCFCGAVFSVFEVYLAKRAIQIPVRQSVRNGSDPNLELLCYSPRVFEILRRARETERLTE